MPTRLALTLLLLPLATWAAGVSPDRDFTGNWVLDAQQSDTRRLSEPPAATLKITAQGPAVHCTELDENGRTLADWSFRTDGEETRSQHDGETRSTETKWEGASLLTNTLASGRDSYVIAERWKLSKDNTVLTITRTIQHGGAQTGSKLVYQNPERLAALPKATAQALSKPVAPPPNPRYMIEKGTKIPLTLVNSLNTKFTAEGDRVYLETAFPILQQGRIVIPKGSFVAGTVTSVKPAGRMRSKPDLYLRFDSLTLPNGVTRDFRSRLDSADEGQVDKQEGKITGESDKVADARKVAEAAGAGAGVGGIAGAATGHPIGGVGIGAAAGAAVGVAAVLLSHGPDLILPKGTTLEMVLDRPLYFQTSELAAR